MSAVTWTPERVELLRKHMAAKMSARDIAEALGVTRNAVIGKWGRLGLGPGRTIASPRAKRVRSGGYIRRAPQQTRVALALAVVPEESFAALPTCQRVSMDELTEQTCRWPIGSLGEADFGFCGGAALSGLPYCAHHTRLARGAPRARRSDDSAYRSKLEASRVNTIWR